MCLVSVWIVTFSVYRFRLVSGPGVDCLKEAGGEGLYILYIGLDILDFQFFCA